MSLVQAKFDTESLCAFINGFGEGVNDLRCQIANMKMTASVDVETHFFTNSVSILMMSDGSSYKQGDVFIPQIDKVVAFLKFCDRKTPTMLRHSAGILTLSNGDDTYTIPTYRDVLSYASVERAHSAIEKAKRDSWGSLGRAKIQAHGSFMMSELHGLQTMTKATAKDAPVRVSVTDGQMKVSAGQARGARMTRVIETKSETTWEDCQSVFSSSLPSLLRIMPSCVIHYHMGEKSALVLDNQDTGALLVLKHQEGIE